MNELLHALTRLALDVQKRPSLEELLQTVVERSAELLGAEHASLRLLDPGGTQLVSAYRTSTGYEAPRTAFRKGEGLIGWIAEHCAPLRTDDPHRDPRFEPRPEVPAFDAFLGVPLMAGRDCMGVLSVLGKAGGFTQADEATLTLVAAICAPYLQVARLSRLSQIDSLTGALNRRGLEQYFEADGRRREASLHAPLSVAMVDVDRFKSINDAHGHAVGDEVLRHLARILGGVTRAEDAIVRWGGEEFLLVLPGVGLEHARTIAERARQYVERSPAPVGHGAPITVSIGVAQQRQGETELDVIARADAAMYRAKAAGRNRVILAG